MTISKRSLPSRRGRPVRVGLTLLELMLAMALSGLILYGVGMAVDLHLRTLQQRRGIIEQARVARSIMRLISGDLKRVVTKYEQDLTALESLGEGAAAEALATLAASGGDAADAVADAIGDAGGAGSGGSGGGDAGSGATGGDAGGGDELTDGGEEEESAYTGDIANSTALPPNPGLYGNQYQLQLDISRLPRFDEFFQETPNSVGDLVDVASDIKTVAYYVQTPQNAGVFAAKDVFGDATVTGGLVRRQLDRTVTQFALASGNSTGLQEKAEIIAPEILAVEFRYYDGLEWLFEWDSDLKAGLPMAVEIIVMVRPVSQLNTAPVVISDEEEPNSQDVFTYRMIVRLPTAESTFGNEEEAADLEAVGL